MESGTATIGVIKLRDVKEVRLKVLWVFSFSIFFFLNWLPKIQHYICANSGYMAQIISGLEHLLYLEFHFFPDMRGALPEYERTGSWIRYGELIIDGATAAHRHTCPTCPLTHSHVESQQVVGICTAKVTRELSFPLLATYGQMKY